MLYRELVRDVDWFFVIILSSIFIAIVVFILVVYKDLKEVKQNINKLSNDRLDKKTTNHNFIQSNLNQNSEYLKNQHTKILDKLYDIDKFLYGVEKCDEQQFNCLKGNQEDTLTELKSIKSIMNYTLIKVQIELNQLNDENDVLNETITKLQKQVQEKELVIENFQKEE